MLQPPSTGSAGPDRSAGRQRRGRITVRNPGGMTADSALLTTRADPTQDSWRALRIMSEFVDGFDALSRLPPAISVFGSARLGESDPGYDLARRFGAAAAEA